MKVPGGWGAVLLVTATLRSPGLYFSVSYLLSAEISGAYSLVVTPR